GTIKRAFTDRWIDVYETAGKRGGAYSDGGYSTNPFILLNFQNSRDSMFTLAHELGHSIHSFYTRHHQPFPYGEYTIFVAEFALAQQILHEGKPAVDRYLKFLSSGSSDYSIELLKKAGVDMTSPGPVRQALQLFESHLAQMEELIGVHPEYGDRTRRSSDDEPEGDRGA